MLCQNVVPLVVDDKGRMLSNTYCMQPKGHAGECDKREVKTVPGDVQARPQGA